MHPNTVGQLFCAHLVKVQANKNRKEKNPHTCTQQILNKKGIISKEKKPSKAQFMRWKK